MKRRIQWVIFNLGLAVLLYGSVFLELEYAVPLQRLFCFVVWVMAIPIIIVFSDSEHAVNMRREARERGLSVPLSLNKALDITLLLILVYLGWWWSMVAVLLMMISVSKIHNEGSWK